MPGHSSVTGNERADCFAGMATVEVLSQKFCMPSGKQEGQTIHLQTNSPYLWQDRMSMSALSKPKKYNKPTQNWCCQSFHT
jgi:hypothetical protein